MESTSRNLRPRVHRSIAHRASINVQPVIDLTISDDEMENQECAADTIKEKTKNLYDELKEMEEQQNLVRNMTEFFCCDCQEFTEIYDGFSIRNCLHEICIVCARKLILESKTLEIPCPITNCDSFLQDREVRDLLTQSEYEHHVNKIGMANNNNNFTEDLYKELQELEEQSGFITNLSSFECEICLMDIEIGDGMMIRECLHQFCIDCIRSTINTSEEAIVKCPSPACDCNIQDREIRSLLTQSEFDKYSMRTLRIAESTASNSFHCKKPNCTGWAVCDEEVSFFRCPICLSGNCISCQAIHPNQNCAQYQEELKFQGMTDDQRSCHKLDEIVKKQLGMRCPTCKIVIMKREGCDWLICSMCKTELCWATKMRRWGPGGRGDTSDGCRCSTVKKCHPNCRNCH